MKTRCEVKMNFQCSMERAFKTPILGDATKILTGFGVIPPVTHFTDDETWGSVLGKRIPHAKPNFFSKGGAIGIDTVLVRTENTYWKWEVKDFMQPSLGFTAFQGELLFSDLGNGSIEVKWRYTLFSNVLALYPIQWLFTKVFWKGQMRRGIRNMKVLAETEAPYIYQ